MDISRLSLNTATIKSQCNLEQAIDLCKEYGIPAIGPWRDKLEECGIEKAAKRIQEAGLRVSGLCRGGFFALDHQYNWDDNKRAIDEALAIHADCLVIVSGGMIAGSKKLADTHKYITEGLAKMVDYAKPQGMPIALEPLHPMYAADRCSINTLGHSLDICEEIGDGIGVAIDAYHVWWDPQLAQQLKRAGELKAILGYHVCDWLSPTKDMLVDRGMMGDGIIDLKDLSNKVSEAGYEGFVEVEIFSTDWWAQDAKKVIENTVDRFERFV